MTEVEMIQEINNLRAEKDKLSDPEQIAIIDAQIAELVDQLQPVEKSRDQKAFLDECAG